MGMRQRSSTILREHSDLDFTAVDWWLQGQLCVCSVLGRPVTFGAEEQHRCLVSSRALDPFRQRGRAKWVKWLAVGPMLPPGSCTQVGHLEASLRSWLSAGLTQHVNLCSPLLWETMIG